METNTRSGDREEAHDCANNPAPPGARGGQYLKLSLQRRWMGDLLAACLRTPIAGTGRPMAVSAAATARRALRAPPSWTAIIVKAYALVAVRRPELRRIYLTMPWPQLYEHHCSVATVVIERDWNGESALFMEQIMSPEMMPLSQIDTIIRGLSTNPVEASPGFRRMISISKLPRFLRRPVWWYALRCSGRLHALCFGTFSVNSIPVKRWELLQTATVLTMSLTHGPLEPSGHIRLWGAFDHRIFDGKPALRSLAELEKVINNEIVTELRAMAGVPAVPTPAILPSRQ